MSRFPIAFVDSGIGGLPYLEWLAGRLPNESYVYVADNKNFPYGIKSREELLNIMHALMKELTAEYSPKAAVIACNTASVISLSYLREMFNIPFIGVVPAVKPAAFTSGKKSIGLMASDRTIEDEYTEKLIKDFAADCKVHKYRGTNIIDFIENRLYGSSSLEVKSILKPAVDFFKHNGVDKVVLGCTHFLFLEEYLREMLGEEIEIVDSREGVGRQIIRVLENNQLLSDQKNGDYFILTGKGKDTEKKKNYNWISDRYGLCAV